MKYVMVTKFDKHWDKIEKGETSYGIGMLRDNMSESKLAENTETIFIKKERDIAMSQAWRGSVGHIRRAASKGKKKIYFSVTITEQIDFPEKYRPYSEGWYLEENDENQFIPPFFNELCTTTDWSAFESLTASLLRILGINDVYTYERHNQRGQADGIFIFRNVVVIYDCTLDSNYARSKATQIENFINQLNKDRITIHDRSITIKDYKKRVWIITRNKRNKIKQIDDIIAREIPVSDLQQLYLAKMSENITSEELEKRLLAL
jgi:hypothetical protein